MTNNIDNKPPDKPTVFAVAVVKLMALVRLQDGWNRE